MDRPRTPATNNKTLKNEIETTIVNTHPDAVV